jgi:hypothetical protein
MIEIYVLVENEPLMMELEISLEFSNEYIYDFCYKAISEEAEGKEFDILLIKHHKAFLRNIELYFESFYRYSTKQQKDINIKWLAEFSEMFGDIRKMKEPQKGEMLEFYFDELGNRFKELKKEYDFIINKKYGIPTKTRFEEKIRRLGSSNK